MLSTWNTLIWCLNWLEKWQAFIGWRKSARVRLHRIRRTGYSCHVARSNWMEPKATDASKWVHVDNGAVWSAWGTRPHLDRSWKEFNGSDGIFWCAVISRSDLIPLSFFLIFASATTQSIQITIYKYRKISILALYFKDIN